MILAFFIAGLSGVCLIRGAGARGTFSIAGGVVLGLALSGALFSAGLMLFGLTGGGSDALLLLLAVRFGNWKREAPANPPPRPPLWLALSCAAAAAVVAALFVEHSIRYPDGGWDAVAIWNLRARAIFAAPRDLALVFTPELGAQHPDYPPLLPALVAHAWFAVGVRTQFAPIVISFLFGAACVAALAGAVSERRGPAPGLAAALLLLGTPDFLTLAWNQYADLKVAALLLVAVALASGGRLAAAGLAAGLAAYTKNEGLVELALLAAAVLAVLGRRAALRFLAGAALPLLLLLYFKLRWAPPNDLVSQTHLTAVLQRAPWRIGIVARAFGMQVVDFAKWGCALPFVLLCWLAGFRRRERTVGALFAGLSLLAVFGIFLATPQNPVEHMRDSLDRLLFQLWPSIIYATAVSLIQAEEPAGAAPPRSAADPA